MTAIKSLIAASWLLAILTPAHAESTVEGVKVIGLWQYLGASAYAHCIRKEIGTITADTAVTVASIGHARAACTDAVQKAFGSTTMKGGSLPPAFIAEAESIVPATQAYLFPRIASLGPSEIPLKDRTILMLRFPDGSVLDVDDDQKMKLAKVNYLILKTKD